MKLNDEDILEIKKQGMRHIAKAGDYLFHEGDPCQHFVLVEKGAIRVQKVSENGRVVVLYHVDSDHLCILTTSCLMGGTHYDAEGIAETDVELILLPKKEFEELISRSSLFRHAVFESISLRITSLIQKIDDIAFKSIRNRLTQLLMKKINPNNEVALGHQELAFEMGTSREVVTRELKALERDGYIEQERKSIKIIDLDSMSNILKTDKK